MVVLRHRSLIVCALSAAVAAGCNALPWSGTKSASTEPAALPFPLRAADELPAAAGRTAPDEIAANLRNGHREAEAGRLDHAARYYERVLRDEPRNAVAHHRLGVLADERRDYATAERHYRAALAQSPGDADVLNDLGYCYLLQERAADAERTLRAAVAASPRHERGLMNLALLYRRAGDDARAIAVLRTLGSEGEARTRLALLGPAPSAPDVLTASAADVGRPAPPVLTPERRRAMRKEAFDMRNPSSRIPGGGRGLIAPEATADHVSAAVPELDGDVWPATSPDVARHVVTANAEAAAADPLDALPLWSPSARAAGYRPEPAGRGVRPAEAVEPNRYGANPSPRPTGDGRTVQTAAESPDRPARDGGPAMFPLLNDDPTPQLPPPAYGSPGSNAAIGGGRYPAPPEYSRSMTAPPRPDDSFRPSRYRVGHAAMPPAGGGDEYSEDLSRHDADLAQLRAQLHAERALPSGYGGYSPRLAPLRSASADDYREPSTEF